MIWSICYTAFEYYLPLKLDSFGFSFLTIGVLLSLVSLTSFIVDPLFGYIQKYFNKKTLFIISLIIFSLSIIIIEYSKGIQIIIGLARIIYGISYELFDITAYTSIFTNSIESDR